MKIKIRVGAVSLNVENDDGVEVLAYSSEGYALDCNPEGLVAAGLAVMAQVSAQMNAASIAAGLAEKERISALYGV